MDRVYGYSHFQGYIQLWVCSVVYVDYKEDHVQVQRKLYGWLKWLVTDVNSKPDYITIPGIY